MCSGLTSIATQSRVVAENSRRLARLVDAPVTLLWRSASCCSSPAWCSAASARACGSTSSAPWSRRAGLVLVIAVGHQLLGLRRPVRDAARGGGRHGGLSAMFVMQGAMLTFFSFIGFEDTLNVAEEVKQPERTVPHGADPGHARRHRDLHRGRHHRRLGRALARARRRARAADRGDGPRRPWPSPRSSSSASPSSPWPTRRC